MTRLYDNLSLIYFDEETETSHPLRVPLQRMVPANRHRNFISDSLDYTNREIISFGGAYEAVGHIRYEDDAQGLIDVLRSCAQRGATCFLTDEADREVEVYIIEPFGEVITPGIEQDGHIFREWTVPVRLRRVDRLAFPSWIFGGSPEGTGPWEIWDPALRTFTDVATTNATNPAGPSGINPVRGWLGQNGFKLFLDANPNTGEPRLHVPDDGTGLLAGEHSIEIWDGGNNYACTDPDLLALINESGGFTLIAAFRHVAGGAASDQFLVGLRDTVTGDWHKLLRGSGVGSAFWRTTRGALNSDYDAGPDAGTDISRHVRTEIFTTAGLLTQRLDADTKVSQIDWSAELGITFDQIRVGGGGGQTQLNAFIGPIIIGPPNMPYRRHERSIMTRYEIG